MEAYTLPGGAHMEEWASGSEPFLFEHEERYALELVGGGWGALLAIGRLRQEGAAGIRNADPPSIYSA